MTYYSSKNRAVRVRSNKPKFTTAKAQRKQGKMQTIERKQQRALKFAEVSE